MPLAVEFRCNTYAEVLKGFGAKSVTTLDFLDSRADIRHDMNTPIPGQYRSAFDTLIDIGCLEHVFDTAQCLENCMSMVRPGGHFVLHTPVKGYFRHGIHVFDPDALTAVFAANGFTVLRSWFSDEAGNDLTDPAEAENVILWMVSRRDIATDVFKCPQQDRWAEKYGCTGRPEDQP
jgi:SAM-dependent methyltransferase